MIDWLVWIGLASVVLAALSALALWSFGRFARQARGQPSQAIAPGNDAPLDRLLAPLERAHPGQTGASLLFDPTAAFAARQRSAMQARRSLDLLYYIWEDDLCGRLLAHALLEAADHGVRVRLLLDDVNVVGRDPLYLALDRHPNVSVRLFNPIRNRESALRRGVEMVLHLVRYNRRMHGKAWIADGRLAMVGGRNIGNADFGAGTGRRRNNDDIDMLLAGPAVRDLAAIFDSFWNAGQALPISALWGKRKSGLARLRLRLNRFVRSPEAHAFLDRLPPASERLAVDGLVWSAGTALVGDPPEKALGTRRTGWLPEALMPLLLGARKRVRIMSPYLVPGSEGLAALVDLAGRGVSVEVVTNALAVADHVTVHGAYRWYRKPLLAAGVRLHEFAARRPTGAWPANARSMLHGKAFVVDDRKGFVGSFNFDMCSAYLNTELGAVFDHPVLVAQLGARFDWAVAPDRAHRLALDGPLVGWSRGASPPVHLEPESTWTRRILSFLIGHLPVHRWL